MRSCPVLILTLPRGRRTWFPEKKEKVEHVYIEKEKEKKTVYSLQNITFHVQFDRLVPLTLPAGGSFLPSAQASAPFGTDYTAAPVAPEVSARTGGGREGGVHTIHNTRARARAEHHVRF